MAVNAHRRMAATGLAGGLLAVLALLFAASSLMFGLGARDDASARVAYGITPSEGGRE